MSEDEDLAELMQEPPGGVNHGWRRVPSHWDDKTKSWSRTWSPLSQDTPELPGRLVSVAEHGTLTKYFARGCRCEDCRRAATEWKRKRRAQDV